MKQWTEVTQEWNRKHPDERLSRQRIQQIHDNALLKLREALGDTPVIRDWQIDMGIDIEDQQTL